MISFLFFLFTLKSFSFPSELNSVSELLGIHEFYQDNELITRPLDAWQTIASFSVVNRDLSLSKLCLKYRPAKEAKGVFKIDLTNISKSCELDGHKIYEQDSLFGIQFQRAPHFKVIFSHKDYSLSSWIIPLPKKEKQLNLLDTPDKYWGESVLILSDHTEKKDLLADGTKCLQVNDDCTIRGDSLCHQCQNGFLEAPNGCLIGPQYCSSAECGTKGNPACRRGVKFQKKRILDCRQEIDFAFCMGDSVPTCQGQEVWCL